MRKKYFRVNFIKLLKVFYFKNKQEIFKDLFIILLLISVVLILAPFDNNIIYLVSKLQNRYLLYLANLLNNGFIIMGFFVALISIFAGEEKRWHYVIPASLAILFSWLVAYTIKLFFVRPRPNNIILYLSIANFHITDYSFPSAHAMLSFALLPFLIKVNPELRYLWILVSFLIAISRIYIGVHYLSDVIAGGAIGYIIGKYILIFFESYNEIKRNIK